MIPIFGHNASASSILWVVRITVENFLKVLMFDITVHIKRLAYGSTPVDGSSSSIIGGLPIKAIAHYSFLLFPPLKVPALTFS